MIAQSFDEAFSQVRELVEDFRRNESYFLSTKYTEPRIREDFINKFWMALGWDVRHDEQKNPYEQEVIVERPVEVEGRGKRADYAFLVAPNFRDQLPCATRAHVQEQQPETGKPRLTSLSTSYMASIRKRWSW
jgi:hypothetical protein